MLIVFLFVVLILSLLFTIEPTNLEKSYSCISKQHDQTSINLTVFDFIARFSNYVAFDKIKWLRAFTKYTTQNVITESHSTSMS